jgi:ParB/RepB/Spo0J family partition protein
MADRDGTDTASVGKGKTRRRVSAGDAMEVTRPRTVAAPTAPPEQPSGAGGTTAKALFRELVHSPLNPRRRHDAEAEQQLADNIAEQGLIEPLVVRQVPIRKFFAHGKLRDGTEQATIFEIVAGERRCRAIGRNIASGRWPENRPIDIIIRQLNDKQHVEHALSENMLRHHLDPIEEAEGFAKLREMGDKEPDIARRLGISERMVWRRLRLLGLDEEWREALSARKVTQAEANAVADAPADLQISILTEILSDPNDRSRRHPSTLRARVTSGLPRVEWAVFERERYDGPLLRNEEDEQDAGCFGDVEQFKRLQEEAIGDLTQKMAAEGGWAFVERVGADWHRHWQFGGETRDAKAGLLVEVTPDLARVTLRENYVPIPAPALLGDAAEGAPAGEQPEISSGRYVSRAQLGTVRAAKTRSLQEEVARYSHLAQSLVCLALLGGPEIMIRRFYHPERQDELLAQRIQDSLPAGFEPFDGFMVRAEDSDKAARNLELLMAEDAARVAELLAHLVARDIGCWHNGNGEPGDSPLACMIAKMTDLAPVRLEIDEAYLKAYPDMDGLRRLASAASLAPFPAATKKGAMVEAFLALPNLQALCEVMPETRFASRTETIDAFAGLAAARGVPKSEPEAAPDISDRPPGGAPEGEAAAPAPGKSPAAVSPSPARQSRRRAAMLPAQDDGADNRDGIFIIRRKLPDRGARWRTVRELADLPRARAEFATEITVDRKISPIGTEWQLVREVSRDGKADIAEVFAHSRLDKKGKGSTVTILTADLDLEIAAREQAGAVFSDPELGQ